MPWKSKIQSVKSNHLGKAQHTLSMEQTLENYYLGLRDANVKILGENTDNVINSNKCNQCEKAYSNAGNLRRHLKTHSGEKSSRCNQCNYASFYAGDLRKHLKIHSGEKSKSQTSAINATLHVFRQAI